MKCWFLSILNDIVCLKITTVNVFSGMVFFKKIIIYKMLDEPSRLERFLMYCVKIGLGSLG